jgi:predicted metal-dependent enzyme (double-stranded beta helix superfamily)
VNQDLEKNLEKVAYKPVGLVLSVAAGAVAGMIFKQVWRLASGENDAPDATDEDRGWGEILVAAALQGAIFAVVKALIDRGGAAGVRKLTGAWPD